MLKQILQFKYLQSNNLWRTVLYWCARWQCLASTSRPV